MWGIARQGRWKRGSPSSKYRHGAGAGDDFQKELDSPEESVHRQPLATRQTHSRSPFLHLEAGATQLFWQFALLAVPRRAAGRLVLTMTVYRGGM